ncbi:MAG: hypothetical protein L3J16_02530, partial [Anaerolineales bacterium]|nr:hypothetical protein [Anaerolineales bacterium]
TRRNLSAARTVNNPFRFKRGTLPDNVSFLLSEYQTHAGYPLSPVTSTCFRSSIFIYRLGNIPLIANGQNP